MSWTTTLGGHSYGFADLRELLAKATPARSGDVLAGVAAESAAERVAAQTVLADLPLAHFLDEAVVPYEDDDVTRLIMDSHDAAAFAPVRSLTVGGFRDWLLSWEADTTVLSDLAPGLTPEMVAAVSKLMRVGDLVAVGRKTRVVTGLRTTIGLEGRLATRLQPNHPTDDPVGITASLVDGLLHGAGDAVVGINPATDRPSTVRALLELIDDARQRLGAPIQSCVLTHVTTTLELLEQGAPVDLVFQSVAGTQAANRGFGVTLDQLREAHAAASELHRGTVGNNVTYFETGQGSALSADAHHDVDEQTLEARAYAVCRAFDPLLVNTVVGFIGPEYLFDGKQILRAGLEDHLCGKLLGVPMGVDVCYTNHAEADADDTDTLLLTLGAAGCSFVITVPGGDDIMLNYQSLSFQDVLQVRQTLGLRPGARVRGVAGVGGAARRRRTRAAAGARADPGVDGMSEVDPWDTLRAATRARVGLGRAGDGLSTAENLRLAAAHAQARDAVHTALDADAIVAALGERAGPVVHSQAADRAEYLQRPDLGRRLAPDHGLEAGEHDLVVVISDGLSARAVQDHAVAVVDALLPRLEGWSVAPVVVAEQARVALGDEIAVALGGRMVLVLIGERPGMSSPDSLGAYLTFEPRPGRVDSERNCVSNIRPPDGLTYDGAAEILAALHDRVLPPAALGRRAEGHRRRPAVGGGLSARSTPQRSSDRRPRVTSFGRILRHPSVSSSLLRRVVRRRPHHPRGGKASHTWVFTGRNSDVGGWSRSRPPGP